jgi:DNA polymerase-3 subunit epsilon
VRKINPEMPIPANAAAIHGITDEMVKDCPTFKQVARGILDFISGCDIGGYNSNYYDVPLLYMEFFRAGLTWDYAGIRFVDAAVIFKRKEERTLTKAYQVFCGKQLENAHSAEADVMATMEVFFAQLEKYTDLPESLDEIDRYCNYDMARVDLTGRFTIDADGDFVFNFGKNKGFKARNDLQYCQWILGAGFPPDATEIARQTIVKYQKSKV